MQRLIRRLESPDRSERLAAAASIGASISCGEITRPSTNEVNNHVHTIYSFSPYSPSSAAYRAWEAGLQTVGIMDHDSIAGGEEMLDASASIGIASTVGFELRVTMTGTAVEGRRINNPDSNNIAYIAVHGIPRGSIGRVDRFLDSVRDARNRRNRSMCRRLNELTADWGLPAIDYERDVYDASRAAEGGSITERHLLFALARIVVDRFGRGPEVVRFLKETAAITAPRRVEEYLEDAANPHYLYDLLGVFKVSLVPRIYLQPDSFECVPVRDALAFAESIGAVSAYPYLGDVTDSPTGDKKPERFEDSYLDELFVELKRLGFRAVTYMPPRNTEAQLERIRRLCRRHGLMEISGVDINSSRQSFNCPEIARPGFVHLTRAAWALIAHEKLADVDPRYGFFRPDNPWADESLDRRMDLYAEIGASMDPRRPDSIVSAAEKLRNRL